MQAVWAADGKILAKLAAERDRIAGRLDAERKEFALQLRAANAERDSLFWRIGELNRDALSTRLASMD